MNNIAIIESKMNHFAWTKEETILQVHVVGPWGIITSIPQMIPGKNDRVRHAPFTWCCCNVLVGALRSSLAVVTLNQQVERRL